MSQTDINSNAKSKPITWTCSSFTSMHKPCTTNDLTSDSFTHSLSSPNHVSDDENIDWDFVTKQLESKLRTSSDIIQSQSYESYHSKLPPKNDGFRPITNHKSIVTEPISSSISSNDTNTTLHSILALTKQNLRIHDHNPISNAMETNMSTFSNGNNSTSTLHELFNELTNCQRKQIYLLEKIQQLIQQTKQISSSLTFFLPLNSLNNNHDNETIPSLQDAFQQRKSSFIQQSKQRMKDISHHQRKHHHRIIPNIKQTNNSYLQQRRQYENDRLCAMIIKHQNRQNAKIYGKLIQNQLSLN